MWFFFLFNDTSTTEIYSCLHSLSLHDALPIDLLILLGTDLAEVILQLQRPLERRGLLVIALGAQAAEFEAALLVANEVPEGLLHAVLDAAREIGRAHV